MENWFCGGLMKIFAENRLLILMKSYGGASENVFNLGHVF